MKEKTNKKITSPHLGEPGRRHTELQTEDRPGEHRC